MTSRASQAFIQDRKRFVGVCNTCVKLLGEQLVECTKALTDFSKPDPYTEQKLNLWLDEKLQLRKSLMDLYHLERTMVNLLASSAATLSGTTARSTLEAYNSIVAGIDAEAKDAKLGLLDYLTFPGWSPPQHKAYIRRLVRHHWRVLDRLKENRVPAARALLGEFVEGLGKTLTNLRWLTTVFVCYAHKYIVPKGARVDDTYFEDLRAATEAALGKEHVFLWWDRKPPPKRADDVPGQDDFWEQGIQTGLRWEEEIKFALRHCDLALALMSPRFHASDFIQKKELFTILRRRTRDGQCLLPIRLEKCDSEEKIEIAMTQWFPPDEYIRQMYASKEKVVKTYRKDLVRRVLNAMEMLSDPTKIDGFVKSFRKRGTDKN